MDASLIVLIIVVFLGFTGIAFAVLMPVHLFLNREEKLSEYWTEEAIARRMAADTPAENTPES
ncbi:MAG TPA: hypothetical protein VFG50_15325 [Rhodothermales bacterium]|nr:hypothetical protein [Rhodothermales bacterium]